MNRNRNGISVVNANQRRSMPNKHHTKFRDFVELLRYENGLQVISIMPYIHEEVQQMREEGWRVIQRWRIEKPKYEKRNDDD